MSARPGKRRGRLDWPLALVSLAALLVCLFYTLAFTFLAPHPGITIDAEWTVVEVDPCDAHPGWCQGDQDRLQVGDRLVAIGGLAYEAYRSDRQRVPFGGYRPGDLVPITLRRDGHGRDRRRAHRPAGRRQRPGPVTAAG